MKTNKHVRKIKPYVGGKPIAEVRREFGLKSVIKLASNENPFPPSPRVLKAIAAAAREVNRYPDGACYALRQELARRHQVAADQLVFGCGSDEIIVMALRAFTNEGDEVVMAKPSFMVYSIAATAAGARCVEVPLKGLAYDLPAMKKAVTPRTRLVFIGNPDNPAGTFAGRTDIAAFMKGLSRDVLVFFDEAYFEFARDEKDYLDAMTLLRTCPNVIVARTFSKLFGLAGLRVGYAAASPEVADLLNRAREPFNVTSIAQAAAMAALKDEAYYENILKILKRERDVVCAGLELLGLSYSRGFTNFIQVRLPVPAAGMALRLMKKGVIVRDMGAWGLKDYIRVTVGIPAENRKFLKVLKENLQGDQ
ncbi:MAG: histidinol-phosphate transaminase [Candidatus Omnitrophota bacterium]